MSKGPVMIGADAVGLGAVSGARRGAPALEIVAADRGGSASYCRCGLHHRIGGVAPDRAALVTRTAAAFAFAHASPFNSARAQVQAAATSLLRTVR